MMEWVNEGLLPFKSDAKAMTPEVSKARLEEVARGAGNAGGRSYFMKPRSSG